MEPVRVNAALIRDELEAMISSKGDSDGNNVGSLDTKFRHIASGLVVGDLLKKDTADSCRTTGNDLVNR